MTGREPLSTHSATTRPPLWACHECQMIGNQQEAHGHQQAHGHDIEELSQEISDGIREEWRKQQARRAAGFLRYGKGPLWP